MQTLYKDGLLSLDCTLLEIYLYVISMSMVKDVNDNTRCNFKFIAFRHVTICCNLIYQICNWQKLEFDRVFLFPVVVEN